MADPVEDFFSYKDDQDKGAVVFKDIRKTITKELRLAEEEYIWDGKLHPSSLCFNMCPKTFLRTDVRIRKNKGIKMNFLGSAGSTSHREFQDKLLRGNVLYPDLPSFRKVDPRLRQSWLEKIIKNFPEIPCLFNLASMKDKDGKEVFLDISGIADSVIELRKKPAVQDFKFKHIPAEKWEAFKTNMLPLDKDVTQIAVYAFIMNNLKYYKDQIEWGDLSYYDKYLLGEQEAELECFIDLKPLLPMVEQLFEELVSQWVDIIKGKDSPCAWEYCKDHGNGWTFGKKKTGVDKNASVPVQGSGDQV